MIISSGVRAVAGDEMRVEQRIEDRDLLSHAARDDGRVVLDLVLGGDLDVGLEPAVLLRKSR
jgi:hypothetical protein